MELDRAELEEHFDVLALEAGVTMFVLTLNPKTPNPKPQKALIKNLNPKF